jgi:hypothetical protein
MLFPPALGCAADLGLQRGRLEHFQEKWNFGFPSENATRKEGIFRRSGIPVFRPAGRALSSS